MNHFAADPKPTQHCRSTVFQLKKKKLKTKILLLGENTILKQIKILDS